ncbi:hypothetical protein E2C01_083438 [Portunus trituberculatus]|uniref:Uncharacterized protein n=1 Tax=Portunus trituberculatus TaxID=210409 RepID=A0A5B7ISG1_PORTR|nr:hypothetical protein [Portunus trituberculatus]
MAKKVMMVVVVIMVVVVVVVVVVAVMAVVMRVMEATAAAICHHLVTPQKEVSLVYTCLSPCPSTQHPFPPPTHLPATPAPSSLTRLLTPACKTEYYDRFWRPSLI